MVQQLLLPFGKLWKNLDVKERMPIPLFLLVGSSAVQKVQDADDFEFFWFKIQDANKSQRAHTSTAITQLALSKDMRAGQAFRCASLSRLERHMCYTQKACVCVA